jgi:hypothetical protein
LLWAAHGGDLKTKKKIDFSVMEPDNRDLCHFLNEQVHFSKIKQNTDKLDKDWLVAMTMIKEEEQTVDNLTSISDANFGRGIF